MQGHLTNHQSQPRQTVAVSEYVLPKLVFLRWRTADSFSVIYQISRCAPLWRKGRHGLERGAHEPQWIYFLQLR